MTKNAYKFILFFSFSASNLRSHGIITFCKAANFQARGPEKLQIDFNTHVFCDLLYNGTPVPLKGVVSSLVYKQS